MRKQEMHPRTAIVNKSQKNQSKRARSKALAWLAKRFPEAFDNSLRIRPLKKGIMEDILHSAEEAEKEGISNSKLREAVVLFTRRVDYLICLKAQERRIDLQGDLVDEVTKQEAELAAAKIRKLVEKSVRNARKVLAEKTGMHSTAMNGSQQKPAYKKQASTTTASFEDYLPIYPPRAPVYPTQSPHAASTKTASVVIKSKPNRQYDPDAVARLKEKLGLARKLEEKEMMSD